MLNTKPFITGLFYLCFVCGLHAQSLVCHIQTSSDPDNICQSKTFTLTGISYDGSENYVKHQWDGEEGIFKTTRDNIAVLNTDKAGQYQITYTVWDDEGQSASFVLNINILPMASKDITIKRGFFKRIFGKSFPLELHAEKGHASYQWFKGKDILPEETRSSLKVSQAGKYRVEITTQQGCKSSAITEVTSK